MHIDPTTKKVLIVTGSTLVGGVNWAGSQVVFNFKMPVFLSTNLMK